MTDKGDPNSFIEHFYKQIKLVDRDIEVVHNYKKQFLDHFSSETDKFKDIETRLKTATENSLKALADLKELPKNLSMKEAAEWVAHVHKERETHFGQLLMKIDAIKEAVHPDMVHHLDGASLMELESELAFAENDLRDIQSLLASLDLKEANNKENVHLRLKEVEEHLEQFDFSGLSDELKLKRDKINRQIQTFRLSLTDSH